MMADADLQVWLDTQPGAHQTVMTPYVKSGKNIRLTYRMEIIQQRGVGSSRINQQGKVTAIAAQPTSLGRLTIGLQKSGECRIEIVLRDETNTTELGAYQFDCPR
jgi:hypothetical protein